MPIADWEQTINNAYAAQGMANPYTEGQASNPYEASNGSLPEYLRLLGQNGAGPQATAPLGTANTNSTSPGGNYGTPGQNPYLSGMADDITRRVNQSRDVGLQGIRGNSVGVGGLGGSRQGVAEGQAISGSADNLAGQLGNLFGTDWTNQQNRDIQNRGLNVQMRGQDIGWQNQTNQFGLNAAQLGSNLQTTAMQNEWYPIQQANSIYGGYAGNGTTTNSTSSGGGASGVLGGLLGGATLGRQAGWW